MSTFQRDNKILQAFYVSLRDIASGDPRCALRRVSHCDQSFHKSHFKHVLSNKKMEARGEGGDVYHTFYPHVLHASILA